MTICNVRSSVLSSRENHWLKEKVFTNVSGNAVAYSPMGASVMVLLKNSDIYIADEGLKQIFTPFYRADKSWNRNRDPGLYITHCPFHYVLLKVS